jgi:chromosome segregation ATPase
MSQSSPIRDNSSSTVKSAALRRPPATSASAILLRLNNHGDQLEAQESETTELKGRIANLERDIVTLGERDAIRVDTLKATAKMVRQLENELEALNEVVAGLLEKTEEAEKNEESSSDSSEEEEITVVEKEKIENSLAAFR